MTRHDFFLLSSIFLVTMLSVQTYAEETKTIFIGPSLMNCVGVGPQVCMMIKESPDSDWTYFYDSIEGFEYEEGFEYKLEVSITEIENPPADASSLKYELVKTVYKNPSPDAKPEFMPYDKTRHIPYDGLCAPGFVPLNEICVLDDRCGPGVYPGKICTMDGKTKSYLKPSQQGNAGIAASDVICAEQLRLIFKSDGSPACVKPESIQKLEDRGWSQFPVISMCTLEYNPVCGVNNKTYGNMCMLESERIAMKHKGECGSGIFFIEP